MWESLKMNLYRINPINWKLDLFNSVDWIIQEFMETIAD